MNKVFGDKTQNAVKKAIDIFRSHNKVFGFAIGISDRELKTRSEYKPDMIFTGADRYFVYNRAKKLFWIRKKS